MTLAEIIQAVDTAAERCPFSKTYRGRSAVAFESPCPVCNADNNGDGGRCVTDRAEHDAVEALRRHVRPHHSWREPSIEERPY